MITETFKTELMTFLSYKDVEFIIDDINKLVSKFDLNSKKKYLNVLVNIFLRYRAQIAEVEILAQMPFIEAKEVTLKNDKEKIETIEVKNLNSYLMDIDLNFFGQYFSAIGYTTPEDTPIIDFTRNSIEQNLSHAINQKDGNMFLPDGLFYSYFKIKHQKHKNNYYLPINISIENIKQDIEKILRFYAWSRATYAWSDFITDIREVDSITDNYQALQWYFDGYYKRSTPFNSHSPKRYEQYLEVVKSNDKSKFRSRIDKVNKFNEDLVLTIKSIFTLLNNPPFGIQKENKSKIYPIFQKFIKTQTKLSSSKELSLEDIVSNYSAIKLFFEELNLSNEEFYELNTNNIISNLIDVILIQIKNKVLPVEFPFRLIWESIEPHKAKEFMKTYDKIYENEELHLLEFLLEYTSQGITSNNFTSYFKKLREIIELEKKLLSMEDLSELDVKKFSEIKKITEKQGIYDNNDLKSLYEVEKNIRHYLNVFKHLWVHDISGDPIFSGDPLFRRFFPLNLGMEKVEYLTDLKNYIGKWEDYKTSSERIKKLQDQISVISSIRFKFEGTELVSSAYPGAMSLIRAQKLILREKTRLILKLKDLINLFSQFKYSDQFNNKIDANVLNKSEEVLLDSSIQILSSIEAFRKELLEKLEFSEMLLKFNNTIKLLIGKDPKVLQLENHRKTFISRFEKFKNDSIILNHGLHVTNINESITKLYSSINQLNEPIKKHYKDYMSEEAIKSIDSLQTDKNLIKFNESLTILSSIYENVSNNLINQFSDVHTYFDVLCDVTEELMQKYGRLSSRKDFMNRLDKAGIKFFEEDGALVIGDTIEENASLLEKQLFLEKTFSLFISLQRACGQIEFALSKSFSHLMKYSSFKPAEKFEKGHSFTEKIKIVMENIDSMYDFINGIKIPSKKKLQELKYILRNINNDFKQKGISTQLEGELHSTIKLISAVLRNKSNIGLIRKLNEALNKVDRMLNNWIKEFISDKVKDQEKNKKTLKFLELTTETGLFNKKLSLKINKMKLLFDLSAEDLSTDPIKAISIPKPSQEKMDPDLVIETQERASEVIKEKDPSAVTEMEASIEAIKEEEASEVAELKVNIEAIKEEEPSSVTELDTIIEPIKEEETSSVTELDSIIEPIKEEETSSVDELDSIIEPIKEEESSSVDELDSVIESTKEEESSSVDELDSVIEPTKEEEPSSVDELETIIEPTKEEETSSVTELDQVTAGTKKEEPLNEIIESSLIKEEMEPKESDSTEEIHKSDLDLKIDSEDLKNKEEDLIDEMESLLNIKKEKKK